MLIFLVLVGVGKEFVGGAWFITNKGVCCLFLY